MLLDVDAFQMLEDVEVASRLVPRAGGFVVVDGVVPLLVWLTGVSVAEVVGVGIERETARSEWSSVIDEGPGKVSAVFTFLRMPGTE
mmetsp:Transcript_26351/g.49162  ORF Transcript_26351/g.49162 Transcript_26351/m.49162 type:complete len:87 (-) Transcript_26351:1084-1344(-)